MKSNFVFLTQKQLLYNIDEHDEKISEKFVSINSEFLRECYMRFIIVKRYNQVNDIFRVAEEFFIQDDDVRLCVNYYIKIIEELSQLNSPNIFRFHIFEENNQQS